MDVVSTEEPITVLTNNGHTSLRASAVFSTGMIVFECDEKNINNCIDIEKPNAKIIEYKDSNGNIVFTKSIALTDIKKDDWVNTANVRVDKYMDKDGKLKKIKLWAIKDINIGDKLFS